MSRTPFRRAGTGEINMKTWFKFLRIAPALLFAALLALGISSATAISAGQYKELRAINGWHLALLFLFPAVLYSIFLVHHAFALQIAGDWRAAAVEWQRRGCPYEQALALMDGDESAQLAALEIFERLGARPATEKLKQQMRSHGMRGIPRGPRLATRENVFGLTAREMEVLACLVEGSSNKDIAKKLSLSIRTVEHHIASILQKMEVDSRNEAVALTLKENLLHSG